MGHNAEKTEDIELYTKHSEVILLHLSTKLYCKDFSPLVVTAMYSDEWGEIITKQVYKENQKSNFKKNLFIKLSLNTLPFV